MKHYYETLANLLKWEYTRWTHEDVGSWISRYNKYVIDRRVEFIENIDSQIGYKYRILSQRNSLFFTQISDRFFTELWQALEFIDDLQEEATN